MKIDKTQQPQVLQRITGTPAAKSKEDVSKAAPVTTGPTDKVELSGLKDEVARLKEKIKEIPLIDEDKVARIKQALESGTYRPDSTSVARSILKGQLADETDR